MLYLTHPFFWMYANSFFAFRCDQMKGKVNRIFHELFRVPIPKTSKFNFLASAWLLYPICQAKKISQNKAFLRCSGVRRQLLSLKKLASNLENMQESNRQNENKIADNEVSLRSQGIILTAQRKLLYIYIYIQLVIKLQLPEAKYDV